MLSVAVIVPLAPANRPVPPVMIVLATVVWMMVAVNAPIHMTSKKISSLFAATTVPVPAALKLLGPMKVTVTLEFPR